MTDQTTPIYPNIFTQPLIQNQPPPPPRAEGSYNNPNNGPYVPPNQGYNQFGNQGYNPNQGYNANPNQGNYPYQNPGNNPNQGFVPGQNAGFIPGQNAGYVPYGNPSIAGQGLQCMMCRRQTQNVPRKLPGAVTWIWCIGLFIFTGCLCCIPFCVDSCQDTELVCMNCHCVKTRIEANCC